MLKPSWFSRAIRITSDKSVTSSSGACILRSNSAGGSDRLLVERSVHDARTSFWTIGKGSSGDGSMTDYCTLITTALFDRGST